MEPGVRGGNLDLGCGPGQTRPGPLRSAVPAAGPTAVPPTRPGLSLRARLLLLVVPPFVAIAALGWAAIANHQEAARELADARRVLAGPVPAPEARAEALRGLQESQDANRRADIAVAAGLVAAFLLVGGSVLILNRQFVRPVRTARRVARRIIEGESGVRLDPSAGAELGELVDVINVMGDELERSRRSLMSTAILQSSPDLVVVIDGEGDIRFASPAATSMLGRPSAWLAGHRLAGFVHPDDRSVVEAITKRIGLASAPGTWSLRLSHVQGRWLEVEVTATDLRSDPSVKGIVLQMRDLTERRAQEEELRHLALHDPLTRLANRALFREHVEHALDRARRTPARPHAVLFIDLDGFKTINDSLGHAAGDEVLVELAERVRTRVRPGDTAARLGGDEFAILLENSSDDDAELIAQRVLDALSGPVAVHGKDVVITGSLGIALSEPGQRAEELMRNADVAMYRAKAAGKGQYQTFRPEMQQAALARLDLEADLRRAIDHGELALHYQPIVGLSTGAITGMEVLVRWGHPQRGLVYPGDFIGVAEESGLILPMGRWILRAALRQKQVWDARFPNSSLTMSVNVSARQIDDRNFFEDVVSSLEEFRVPPQTLVLEITESLLMSDVDRAVEVLTRLKQLGVKLAIDDFGTGYSSLSYLRSMPIDILKIDKAFVDGVTRGPEQSAVAQAVIKLAHTFGLETVAEGIEQPGQVERLAEMRGDMGQGYYFSRPLSAEAMGAYLRRNPRWAIGTAVLSAAEAEAEAQLNAF